MDSETLQNLVKGILANASDQGFEDVVESLDLGADCPESFDGIRTFEEAGMLSNNSGLVIRVGSQEFQIMVVQSK